MAELAFPAECQNIRTTHGRRLTRYVKLTDEPMLVHEVLPWLIERGLVKRVEERCTDPDCLHEHCDGYRLVGWGTTYFSVPPDAATVR